MKLLLQNLLLLLFYFFIPTFLGTLVSQSTETLKKKNYLNLMKLGGDAENGKNKTPFHFGVLINHFLFMYKTRHWLFLCTIISRWPLSLSLFLCCLSVPM